MKNQEYWAKRKANLIYQQMDKAEKQADQFDKVYREAKTYLDKEINKIFDKFQRDYGLSQVDARQVLKNMKDKKDLNELRKVLEARPNDPNIQRLLADLDSPAYSFRMKRLERLSDDLDRMRESIYHSEKTGSDAFYSDLMKDSYYKATFDLQQQTGLAYGFSGLPESEIKHLQSFSWLGDGSTYSTDIWKNTGKLTSSIKDELLMSLMTGRDTRETAQAIAERFNVGQNDARRLVRTESAFFHNQMELLSYEEADIEKYIFVAVLDKRTSRICQEHDNQVYDRDKAVPGVNCPPMHPWCRSTTVGYDEDADYSKLKRRARNPETGKTELVPADMTYKEWYSKYVAKDGEKVYNQGMSSIDLMAKQQSFVVGNDIRVNAKKLSGTEFDFWTQNNGKKIRDTVANVQEAFRQLPDYSKPTVVFLKKSKLPGLAGYDYKQDILFISDALSSEKEFKNILSDGFFAAKDIKEAIVHELTHKQHWDSAKAFYKANKKRYNSLEEAMTYLNRDLVTYVKKQHSIDTMYLYRISINALSAFETNNINELVAEVGVLGNNTPDDTLLQKVQEVLSWK
ncbi:minor capsid protein [Streptococcus mitis]|jgi:phage head morphogenesis protein, SPP1 gp7 family|uniref:minor capsid protein n=1 Tax=Streptococcus mitis TaxID=28037 RepID=UPI001D170A0C|nr:minor capsid protein [Streptococcus mitis]